MTPETLELMVSGYMRTNFDGFTPDIIIYVIKIFLNDNNIIACNVYDKDFNKISINGDIIGVFMNFSSYFYVSSKNILYCNGANNFNQLGCEESKNKIVSIMKHPIFNGDKSVFVVSKGLYNHHCFVYTNNNELYGFGRNEYNEISKDIKDEKVKPILIKYNFGSKITQIECASQHTLFLTLLGSVFGCGCNDLGQISKDGNNKDNIIYIKSLKNITNISCSHNSSFAIDSNNILYTFGSNTCCILGIGDDIESVGINELIFDKFKYIETGYGHVACLTLDDKLYCWGYNSYGQCGRNSMGSNLKIPSIVNIDGNIIDVKCGSSHTIVKTYPNEFYSFGNNQDKQLLIHTNGDSTHKPTLISKDKLCTSIGNNSDIIDLIPGFYQTFILQKNPLN